MCFSVDNLCTVVDIANFSRGSILRALKKSSKVSVAVWAVAITLGLAGLAIAATTVGLGTADGFAILAGSGITNTGSTKITGDVGTFPTTSETGFDSVTFFERDKPGGQRGYARSQG